MKLSKDKDHELFTKFTHELTDVEKTEKERLISEYYKSDEYKYRYIPPLRIWELH